MEQFPLISIVSPVYQAEELVHLLVDRILATISPISNNFEIILVEDGSSDQSWQKIKEVCSQEPRVKAIRLSRNFGQHFAISAGLRASRGDFIVIMDCDLQDRPEEIVNLYSKVLEGYDIVQARRTVRKDKIIRKVFSKCFYKFLSFLSGTTYDSSIANFGIYRKTVIQSILKMEERIRYFPAMVNWIGYKKTTLDVTHSERPSGKSAYNFKKMLKLAVNIMLAYSDRPLRLIVGLGLFISFLSSLFALVVVFKYFQGDIKVLGYTSLVISICFFSGVIVTVLGIVGLYVGKIFEGIKNRPVYIIYEELNNEENSL